MTLVRKTSYLVFLILLTLGFKLTQKAHYQKLGKRTIHQREGWDLFYRIWYCLIVSQITFCGIIVEIIWSYNQNNFFLGLQIYSGYSAYTCLSALLHHKFEKVLPLAIMALSVLLSRLVYFLALLVASDFNWKLVQT